MVAESEDELYETVGRPDHRVARQARRVSAADPAVLGEAAEPWHRLAPGEVDGGLFVGHLTLVEILGKDGKVAYGAVIIADGGTVFDAGTTNEAATISQGHVESSKPKPAKALQRVMFARGK